MNGGDLTDRLAELSPAKRALLELRLKQKGLDTLPDQTIRRRAASDSAPLSFAQQRLWFLNQLEPESPSYNQPKTVRLTGALDEGALQKALDHVVNRHETLRTIFVVVDGAPVQVAAESRSINLPVADLRSFSDVVRDVEAQRVLIEAARRPFDLSQDLMLRALLLRLADREHILLLVTHHIASDGWSSGILWRELGNLYGAFSRGEPDPLPELPIQYADYAIWQRQWLQGEALETQLSYWRKQLNGVAAMHLPTDRPRPALQSFHGAKQSLVLPVDLSEALNNLSHREGVTLFMTLLAAFQTLLHRYTGQDDIVVGSPIAGRTRPEIEGLIGFFVNTLILRADFAGNPSFRDLLGRVREIALGAYAHQDLPFEKLVEELHPERKLSTSPLFQVAFALQNVPRQVIELPGLMVSPLELESGTAKFDLYLAMRERPEGLRAVLEYDSDLFDDATIRRMLGHFENLIRVLVADPDRRVSEFPLLTEAERHQLLVEWNDTKRDYPKDKCIHQLFEEQVERTPDAVAVVFEDQQLTYREVNTRANQLAWHLQKHGIKPQSLVGICVDRSIEMVVAVLAVLKAGGAYVPLDPGYPAERLEFMLADAHVSVLLTQEGLLDDSDCRSSILNRPRQWICLDRDWELIARESDANPENNTTADNLAYVIYTSGSTGIPKGVLIEHRGLWNVAEEQARHFSVNPGDRVLQFASLSFDASIFEIVMALCAGARLYLGNPKTLLVASALTDFLRRHEITIATLPPSVLATLSPKELPALRSLCVAGEVCSAKLVGEWVIDRRFFNLYGPTEATIWATVAECDSMADRVSIGRPIANSQIYLLDACRQPVAIGVPGEIYIGGIGVARGYLNRPELTAERFIPNPLSSQPGTRLYRTGDLARYLPDGNIEFLGRVDNQVKIRGYRIELGEIEAVLAQHPSIQHAVVLAREDSPGERRLVAYVVTAPGTTTSATELRSALRQKLPDYMLPSAFVFLDSLPLTPNGKLDRKALPAPDQNRPELDETYTAPRTPTEDVLVKIWAKVLKIEKVGIHDNFFNLGGHSLLATQVISRIRDAFQMDIPLRTLIEKPTVEELAIAIMHHSCEQISEKELSGILNDLESLSKDELKQGLV